MLNADLMARLNSQIDSSLQTQKNEVAQKIENPQKKEKITKIESKVQISLIVPAENKNRWKSFFSNRGISFTNGISMALDYFIKAVENGEIEVDYYGLKTK